MSNVVLIGAEEAAEILGIHSRTLRHRVAAGSIAPAGKLPGRTGAYLFERSAIEALAAPEPQGQAS